MANFLTKQDDSGGAGKKTRPYIYTTAPAAQGPYVNPNPYVYTTAPGAQPKPNPFLGSPAPRGGSGSSTTQTQQTATPERIAKDRAMMSQADWLTKYGNINFDANSIKGIFDAATQAEYAAKKREYDAAERKYYDQVGTDQNSLLDAKRRSAAQNAVQTGANKGMQNAMQLTDLVQKSQTEAPNALMLAEGRRMLVDQEQAAYTANTSLAETTAEQRKLDYAKVGSEVYATDAQKYVGELGYDAAALEVAMTKYGIDKSAARGGGGSSGTSAAGRLSALMQGYGYAVSSGNKNDSTMFMSAIGSELLGIIPPKNK